MPDETARPAPDTFPVVRDLVITFCRHLLVLEPDIIEAAISQGETALTVAPVLDPTLAIKASAELEAQLTLMRGVLELRRVLDTIRAGEPAQ